jgi:CubicO group peptidase (beta-lactamase class C family)
MSLSDATKKEIDEIFKKWTKTNSPGMAIAVKYQGDEYKKGYGMANLEHKIPITPQTVFHVASVGKQFTAMCLVLLSQKKDTHGNPLIHLDDKVRKHIPELLPAKFESITIRQMLQHTSGIREMLALTALAGWRWGDDMISREDLRNLVGRMQTPQFTPPGSDFAYSNTNYFLAGEIVAKVSGMPLAKFAKEKIFDKLGMNSTRIIENYGETVSHRAQGYREIDQDDQETKPVFEKRTPPYNFTGPTNLLTTVEDLLKWDANFDTDTTTPTVGGKEAISELFKESDQEDYGSGLYIIGAGNPVDVYHNGVTIGHRAKLYRCYNPFPTHELTIALLSNIELDKRQDERDIDELVEKVKRVVLKKQWNGMPDKPRAQMPGAIALHNPMDYVGRYRSDEIDAEYEVKLDGSSLEITRNKREPVPLKLTHKDAHKDVFWVDGFDGYLPMLKQVELTFERDSGIVSRFFLDSVSNRGRFAGFPFRKIK